MMQDAELAAVPSGIVLGSGFDPRTQSVRMQVSEGQTHDKPNDWQPSYNLEYMSSYSKVAKFFSLDASARYSGMGGSASASLSILKACTLERSKIVVAVKVRAVTGSQYLSEAALTAQALKILSGQPLHVFVDRYGTSYIRKIDWGGELACLLTVSSESIEKLETLRAKMEAEGFGASGGAKTESAIAELSKQFSISVIYSQSGGAANEGANGNLVQTDAPGLIQRMSTFIKELRETDPLIGQVVPVNVEFWETKFSVNNWPDSVIGDPEHPYPRKIEDIAESVFALEDRLEKIKALLNRPQNTVAPSSLEAARLLEPYLALQVSEASKAVYQMKADASVVPNLWIENFFQYRLRNLLGIDPGIHPNAGQPKDAANPDKRQLIEALVGPDEFPKLSVWPEIRLQEWWGYHGEADGAYAGFHWRCAGGETHDPWVEHVYPKTGKNPSANDGIFAMISTHPSPFAGGNHCGYHPCVIVGAYVKEPDEPQLSPLPKLPAQGNTSWEPSGKNVKKIDDKVWEISFAIKDAPSKAASTFIISVTEIDANGSNRTRRLPASYWYNEQLGVKNCQIQYEPASKSSLDLDFQVECGPIYLSDEKIIFSAPQALIEKISCFASDYDRFWQTFVLTYPNATGLTREAYERQLIDRFGLALMHALNSEAPDAIRGQLGIPRQLAPEQRINVRKAVLSYSP